MQRLRVIFTSPRLFSSAKAPKETPVAAAAKRLNLNNAVDKVHESKAINEIIRLPPSALQGIAEHSDAIFDGLKIRSIADLGKWKYYKISKSIATLAAKEEASSRHDDCVANIDGALDKAFESHSFKEILELPTSALSGCTVPKGQLLEKLHINTIGDIASWKYAAVAEALVTLAKFEEEMP